MHLISILPMDDVKFLAMLKQRNLLPGDLKEQINAESTTAKKADIFLEKAIDRSLCIGDCEPLNKLLAVMSDEVYINSDPLKKLAEKIQQELLVNIN